MLCDQPYIQRIPFRIAFAEGFPECPRFFFICLRIIDGIYELLFSFRHLSLLCVLHRPGKSMTIILEAHITCCSKPYLALAGVIVCQEFVGCSVEAMFACSVVVVSCDQNPVSEGERLAPSAFEIFRCALCRQFVCFYRFADCHFPVLPCFPKGS